MLKHVGAVIHGTCFHNYIYMAGAHFYALFEQFTSHCWNISYVHSLLN